MARLHIFVEPIFQGQFARLLTRSVLPDGPLLYPFNRRTRFAGPISYWDEKHRDREFRLLEHLPDVVLVLLWWRDRN